MEDKALIYSTKVDDELKYSFERILPGNYKLWIFQDNDMNKKYNFGKVIPYELSEPFYYSKDTLNLRALWPVGDVNINFVK